MAYCFLEHCVCLFVKAVFERVMMPDPEKHLVNSAAIVDPAAESHPVRYLCDSFVRLKTKSRANTVNCAILTTIPDNLLFQSFSTFSLKQNPLQQF